MFIDQEWKKQMQKQPAEEKPKAKKPSLLLYLSIIAAVFLMAAVFVFWYYLSSIPPRPAGPAGSGRTSENSTNTPAAFLPGSAKESGNGNGGNFLPDDLKAEDLRFGNFYNEPSGVILPELEPFSLPMNIKMDVFNYYDISRKAEIDGKVEELNENAFAFLDDQFDSADSDFFAVNRRLLREGVPLFVSTDFVSYYNQNVLKTVYQEIEKSVFYENLWDIAKKLYDISLSRYRRGLDASGIKNDPVLEGERLETAYLAVILSLLRPKEGQINQDENFADESLFSREESEYYHFEMTAGLKKQVDEEIALINAAGDEPAKSPVFLYEKDYRNFKVPAEYSKNAKLKNYYLAKKWMSAVFPLYYKDENCPDCLLDYSDWLNNFCAAALLSEDLKDNQDIKNRWAAIYKFIAFFEGLLSDLTYLHVNSAFEEEFGGSYDIKEMFANENPDRRHDLEALRDNLAKNEFLPIEGAIDRESARDRPMIGVRILQKNYWPNDYIFESLTGEDMVKDIKARNNEVLTACSGKNGFYRCLGFGGDILSLHGLKPLDDPYFFQNIDYKNYGLRISQLRKQLEKFDIGTWNSNVYWINFSLTDNLIRYSRDSIPFLSFSDAWEGKRIVNFILGSWVNTSLPLDEWENYKPEKGGKLNFFAGCDPHNYVEPNLMFYKDLMERNKMLLSAVEVLRVGKKTNAASILISDMNKKLAELIRISEKEIKGEAINEEECRAIEEFAGGIKVIDEGEKHFKISGDVSGAAEMLKGVKLLALVYRTSTGKKTLVIGPVFNYQEGFSKMLR